MPKLYLIFVFSTFLAINCQAQLFNDFELNGGFYFGKPFKEKETGPSPFKDDMTTEAGVTTEAIVYSKLGKRTAVGTGIKFIQANYEHIVGGIRLPQDVINFTSSAIRNNVTITNIGIPILCKYNIIRNTQLLQVVSGFGIYRSIKSVSENKVTGAAAFDPVFRNYQIDDISENYNLSTQIGLRALIKIKNAHAISIGGRVEYFLVQDKYYENGQGSMLGYSATIGYVFESIQ